MSPTLKFSALITGTATLFLSGMTSAQAFTVFTNYTAWQNAVNAIAGSVTTTDTFSTDIAEAQSITLSSGVVSTNSFPPDVVASIPFNNNAVLGGLYLNATDSDADNASETITWTFPSPVFAFGANFISTNFGGLTLSGNFDGTGDQTLLVNNSIGGEDGFLGIIGDAKFSSVVFANDSTDVDAFQIDDAFFAVSTPEPSTIMAFALLGGGLLLRRPRKQG